MNPLSQLDAVDRQVQEGFGAMTSGQLNWKPSPEQWSIGQCLHHLIVSNGTYFPTFEALMRGAYRLSVMQRLNPFAGLFGPMMIRSLGPDTVKKFKVPPVFEPASSDLPQGIVSDFLQHQQLLRNYMRRLRDAGIGDPVIASPVTGFVVYRLSDAMQIISGHEQRHVNQAKRVSQLPNFPQ